MKPNRSTIALFVALLFAFATAAALACPGSTVRAGSAKNGKRVSLERGAQLVVSLKGNATTGFAWRIRSVDKSVLKPLAVNYVPNANPKQLVGVGGIYKLHFKAVAKGTTVLKLKYVRGAEPGGTYRLRVVVS